MPQTVAEAASETRTLLEELGIEYSVGTGWGSNGTPVVVVDIPPHVAREPVVSKLAAIPADIVVRYITRIISAH